MLNFLIENLDYAPRRVFAALAAACVAMLLFGMYLQHVVGLEPCPMCIVQRYALMAVTLWAVLAAALRTKAAHVGGAILVAVSAAAGAFVAARQSWLQWYPPEIASCGRDFYGMIENFPLRRALPMIFRGSGDCSKIDWTLLGASIANWSFVCFCALALVAASLLVRQIRR